MENESVKELNVADSTNVEEVSTIEEEVLDESIEFSDTETSEDNKEESDDNKETDSENVKEENISEEESKTKQTDEENSKFAAARRKAFEEAETKTKSKIDEAYRKGKVDAYKGKVNPYTNTEIKDISDIEVYEDMYKIAEQGKDPLKDYASYVADKKREETKALQEQQEREERAQKEINEFSKKYPDVNISELLKDEIFIDYVEGKDKHLIDLYDKFTKLKTEFRNKGVETAKKTIANNISSPGGLNASAETIIDYENMSREQFLKEVEKVKEG